MNVEALQSLGAHDEVAAPAAAAESQRGAGVAFGDRVSEGLQALNEQLLTSQVDLQRLATGETRNLHEVLVRLEESRISLQLMLQVRNRVLEAYQELMRMQV